MSNATKTWLRFEVLLPLQFNDGTPVSQSLLDEAVSQVVNRFGASSFEAQQVEGHWRDHGRLYRDKLAKLTVDAPDDPATFDWMRRFKQDWKARLKQVELWMVVYPIRIE